MVAEANAVIADFVSKADNSNQTYVNDRIAEAEIEGYYRYAADQMAALTATKSDLQNCRILLGEKAAAADRYRDGFFENFVNVNDFGLYIPPSRRGLLSVYLSLGLNTITLGTFAFYHGITGYYQTGEIHGRKFYGRR